MFIDADLGEEGLVGQASVLVVRARVDAADVAGEAEAVVDVVTRLGIVVVVFGEPLINAVEFGAKLELELRELLTGKRFVESFFEKPVLLVDDLDPSLCQVSSLAGGFGGELVEVVVEHAA